MIKINTIGNLPEPVAKVVRGAAPTAKGLKRVTGGEIEVKEFPDVYDMTEEGPSKLMELADERDCVTAVLFDVDKPKDSKGKPRTTSGSLRRAYVVAIQMDSDIDPNPNNSTRVYNTLVFFSEISDTREMERWDREYKQAKDDYAKKKRHDMVEMAAEKELGRLRRKRHKENRL